MSDQVKLNQMYLCQHNHSEDTEGMMSNAIVYSGPMFGMKANEYMSWLWEPLNLTRENELRTLVDFKCMSCGKVWTV